MMKKNSTTDFSRPMMQSYVAILIIMLRFYKVLFRQFFPLIILLFIQGSWVKSNWALFIALPVVLLGSVYSIVAFFRHRFYVNEGKLIVTMGVFKRTRLEIPLGRIQSVNFHQNIIHQVFNVVKLELDTAGSSDKEMELYALDRKKAADLSQVILSHRKSYSGDPDERQDSDGQERRDLVFQLDIWQLLKVGVTENHVRSGGIILFFVFWVYDNLREVGLDMREEVESYIPVAEQVSQNLVLMLFLILLIALISFIISIVRTVLRFYNLKMFRSGDGFVIRSGLIDKKENAAKDHKIQLLQWSQNVLQKWAGLYEMSLKQAASVKASAKKAIKVSGLAYKDIHAIQGQLYHDTANQIDEMTMHSVDRYFLYRMLYIRSYIFIVLLGIVYVSGNTGWIPAVIVFMALAYLSSFLSYRKKKYGITQNLLTIEGGSFGRSKVIMPVYKTQAASIHSNPFQRRRRLATLTIHSASGSVNIPQINIDTAQKLYDLIIYCTEISRKEWM